MYYFFRLSSYYYGTKIKPTALELDSLLGDSNNTQNIGGRSISVTGIPVAVLVAL